MGLTNLDYDGSMPRNLVRYQQSGQYHFVTFTCYARQKHFGLSSARERPFTAELESAPSTPYSERVAGTIDLRSDAIRS